MSLLNMPFDPTREAALVTGAGNGIGRAVAQALVGEGVRTMFADVNHETVTAAVEASPRPELALPWVGDLAIPGERDALLAHAAASFGQVTHFVHSASPPRREADHAMAVSSETWARMHAVNLDAGFHLARELARKLIADKAAGSFLLLTSLHAGTPRNASTSASTRWCRARLRPAALSPIPRSPGTSRSAGSARPRISHRWRWRCCRTGYRVMSRERRSWWTAACR
jgi:NAD(P)-dependent dehydrogenase (short-subunit alcohol dehydrogenase family)